LPAPAESSRRLSSLRDQLAVRADQSDSKVFVFVNIRAKSRARDIGVDLIRDRNDAAANHFEGDGINDMLLWNSL